MEKTNGGIFSRVGESKMGWFLNQCGGLAPLRGIASWSFTGFADPTGGGTDPESQRFLVSHPFRKVTRNGWGTVDCFFLAGWRNRAIDAWFISSRFFPMYAFDLAGL
jgi:hypothetical protein